MATTVGSNDSYNFRGTLDVSQGVFICKDSQILRSYLDQREDTPIAIPVEDWKVHDDLTSFLPTTAASDDLGRILGTFGTSSPVLQTSDAKATTVTQYGRIRYVLTDDYDINESISLQVRAGMDTTISDGTATIDVECYVDDGDGSVGSDICATAAQSINSLTKANLEFILTPTSLTIGDILDIRITIAITDSATGTAVIGEVSQIQMLRDVRG